MSSFINTIIHNKEALCLISKKAFDNVDVDGSGEIDEHELEKILAQISSDMGAEPPSKEDVKEVLDHLDSDHSGTISINEFQELIQDILEALVE